MLVWCSLSLGLVSPSFEESERWLWRAAKSGSGDAWYEPTTQIDQPHSFSRQSLYSRIGSSITFGFPISMTNEGQPLVSNLSLSMINEGQPLVSNLSLSMTNIEQQPLVSNLTLSMTNIEQQPLVSNLPLSMTNIEQPSLVRPGASGLGLGRGRPQKQTKPATAYQTKSVQHPRYRQAIGLLQKVCKYTLLKLPRKLAKKQQRHFPYLMTLVLQ
eukprot:497770-Amorphochlora_amoeboformis.AAC.1